MVFTPPLSYSCSYGLESLLQALQWPASLVLTLRIKAVLLTCIFATPFSVKGARSEAAMEVLVIGLNRPQDKRRFAIGTRAPSVAALIQ